MSHRVAPASRRALTLIEMLIALAVTLVMMAAVVNLFANVSGSIRNRRAVIEVSNQLRQVRHTLSRDLAGATCPPVPTQRPGNNAGYIEILEGQWSDKNPSRFLDDNTGNGDLDYATSLVPSAGDPLVPAPHPSSGYNPSAVNRTGAVTNGGALGDWDDILALTVRSETDPFVAEIGGGIVESTLAEVIWFADEDGGGSNEDGMRRIFRRVVLIAPWLGPWSSAPPNDVVRNVSIRQDGNRWVANTLSDLTKRENRFKHVYLPSNGDRGFKHPLRHDELRNEANAEQLMLADALAFDIRVYDPGAPCYEPLPGTVVEPSDVGWRSSIGSITSVRRFGAYVDLGWNYIIGNATPMYTWPGLTSNTPKPRFDRLALINGMAVYDAWSDHYENDGIDQDNNNNIDQGRNGLDDDDANGVDDNGEREAPPPYETPLRGLQVKLRLYERDARQIREASVTHSFIQ